MKNIRRILEFLEENGILPTSDLRGSLTTTVSPRDCPRFDAGKANFVFLVTLTSSTGYLGHRGTTISRSGSYFLTFPPSDGFEIDRFVRVFALPYRFVSIMIFLAIYSN